MRAAATAIITLILLGGLSYGQDSFEVTGIAIPADLIKKNFGPVPKGIGAYDVMICNSTEKKQSLISSKIYQGLTQSDSTLAPIGRQIMLAAILRNQNLSPLSITGVLLNSAMGVFSLLNSSNYKLPNSFGTATALATLSGQQLFNSFKPILSADQLEKFESQVLEPALILDSGSCVERTVFTRLPNGKPKRQSDSVSFHIR